VAKVTRGSLQPNKKLPSVRAVRIWAKQVQKVGITYFSFVFTLFLAL
jgi:DNA-binding transcriptional regulator YhcF (GntR family)